MRLFSDIKEREYYFKESIVALIKAIIPTLKADDFHGVFMVIDSKERHDRLNEIYSYPLTEKFRSSPATTLRSIATDNAFDRISPALIILHYPVKNNVISMCQTFYGERLTNYTKMKTDSEKIIMSDDHLMVEEDDGGFIHLYTAMDNYFVQLKKEIMKMKLQFKDVKQYE